MKKFLAIATAALLAMSPAVSSAETHTTDFWTTGRSQLPPENNWKLTWSDSLHNGLFFSTDPRLETLSETNRSQVALAYKTVLGLCDQNVVVGCISKIRYRLNGEWEEPRPLVSPGQRKHAFGSLAAPGSPNKWDIAETAVYQANESQGFFRAVEPNLFALEKAPHKFGTEYWINAVTTSTFANGKSKLNGLDISVWATKVVNNCTETELDVRVETTRGTFCNYVVNFPIDLEMEIEVNLGQRISELSGWFDGRITDPQIDFGEKAPGLISVRGKPSVVSSAMTNFIPKGDSLYEVPQVVEDAQRPYGTLGSFISRVDGFENWLKFSSKIRDLSSGTNTYWRLSSWDDQVRGRYGCSEAKGVLGVVLSNAIAYTPGAPNYDRANSTLKFQVAAPHLKADGSQNVGFYDLLIKESVAKCLWGNDMAANKAEISVTNADGSAQVATTTFAVSNGWAKFKAYGFHYSNPAIAVKLTKPAVKKTSITCVRGKLTKKVTATAPKCPTGYKKK